ncbi:MAG: ribonuclease P protein component [Oscillospiraceae bacterium]|nr:ribonuclease P protein component [Oscillospiraceae bacterium]
MNKTVSIKLNRDFRFLYKRGKSAVSPVLAVYAKKTKNTSNRIGITVSTKVGKAVVRNRVRRRIREAYRINEGRFIDGCDVIIVARVRAASVSFNDIEENLLRLSASLGILREERE